MEWKVGKRLTVVVAGAALAFAAIGGAGLAAVVSKPSKTAPAQTTSTSATSTLSDAKKTTICHKGKVTLRVSVNAVAAHQKRHGDTLGACAGPTNAKGKPDKAGKSTKTDDESDDDD